MVQGGPKVTPYTRPTKLITTWLYETIHTHEVYSPNLSTVVLAIGESAGNSGHPPNMVTSVIPGLRRKAAALWEDLD